jgi:hypothetical protein
LHFTPSNSPAKAIVCDYVVNLILPIGLRALLLLLPLAALADPVFQPGMVWRDTEGNRIQAHGGGVLRHGDVYYWHGEDRTPGGQGVVACYCSTNLYDWNREGMALSREDLPRVNGRRTFVERPKVLFNAATGKFVMWMHLEEGRYTYAHAGVAISDRPAGPFTFLHGIRPITNNFEFKLDDPCRQLQLGGTFRDMNLFLDNDGQAYVFYASEDNWTMYVVRLNSDFTGPATPVVEGKTWARIFVRQMREAPAPFKYNNRYYLVTSGCSGWKPNAAQWAVADDILGPWKVMNNPCSGPKAETTFDSQGTFVLPAPGPPGKFIFMADRWNPENLSDSRYVWLPLTFGETGAPVIEWKERWSLSEANHH